MLRSRISHSYIEGKNTYKIYRHETHALFILLSNSKWEAESC